MCLKLSTEATEKGAEGPQTPQGCGRGKDCFIHSLKYPFLTSGPGMPLGPISAPTVSGKPPSDLFPWALMPGLKFVYSLATFI